MSRKRPIITCANCGQVKPHSARGLCPACREYQRRNGRPRPAALIRRQAPLGWCECGAVAVTVREIVVPLGRGHERRYNERLCARCARAEEAA